MMSDTKSNKIRRHSEWCLPVMAYEFALYVQYVTLT
jgi:hypothetical protein